MAKVLIVDDAAFMRMMIKDILEKNDFEIKEIDEQGNISEASISDVYKVLDKDNINVNLVLDSSGSMDEDNKMQQAKNAASALIDKMKLLEGDKAEIISFDTYVYLKQDFTNEKDVLIKAINDINTAGNTALYDAIYSGKLTRKHNITKIPRDCSGSCGNICTEVISLPIENRNDNIQSELTQ